MSWQRRNPGGKNDKVICQDGCLSRATNSYLERQSGNFPIFICIFLSVVQRFRLESSTIYFNSCLPWPCYNYTSNI
ncbi:unnamed protein product [Acanthoscelides obtectus]|uniref:Uncharacterized protein n=1 Tax=Acanthoscelides obtectus TaxID=200917 RepID=A0A9P0KBN7_ACAOB|nr:unnamed protein product [Acanthoscelides obtectus]CAK1645401.1 hypothetical protein AOBTE_LOCUS14103 [Acanthoscelides obtectus]